MTRHQKRETQSAILRQFIVTTNPVYLLPIKWLCKATCKYSSRSAYAPLILRTQKPNHILFHRKMMQYVISKRRRTTGKQRKSTSSDHYHRSHINTHNKLRQPHRQGGVHILRSGIFADFYPLPPPCSRLKCSGWLPPPLKLRSSLLDPPP